MGKAVNMEGLKVGRLSVISRAGVNSDGRVTWQCLCDCGNNTVVSGKDMRAGDSLSCGCLSKECRSKMRRRGRENSGDKMGCKTTATKAELDEILTYDPRTGDLRWRERTPKMIPCNRSRNTWNSKWAGKIAGSKDAATGHLRVKVGQRNLYARRVIYMMMTGKNPSEKIKHKDGDLYNLKWDNLIGSRDAKKMAELVAKAKLEVRPKPKVYPGVVYDNYIGKWRSFINLSKFVRVNVGSFATDKEAVETRRDWVEWMESR